MPDHRPLIALTGAEGVIGGLVRARLAGQFDIRALTARAAVFPSRIVELADLDGLTDGLAGAAAVVHLAAVSRVDAPWPEVLESNLIGAYHLFEAARRADVPRVVFASSNHVTGGYELDGAPDIYTRVGGPLVAAGDPPRPDSLYGVSKGFGELLGRYFSDRFGMTVVCLRLGSVLADDDPTAAPPAGLAAGLAAAWPARIRATWLSHRDCAQLIARALLADVRYAIVFGTSANAQRLWSLEEAERLLGYAPVDQAPG